MEFGLSEDDRLLQDSVSRFLAAEVPLDRVRALAAAGVEGAGFDSTLWQGLADKFIQQGHGIPCPWIN